MNNIIVFTTLIIGFSAILAIIVLLVFKLRRAFCSMHAQIKATYIQTKEALEKLSQAETEIDHVLAALDITAEEK